MNTEYGEFQKHEARIISLIWVYRIWIVISFLTPFWITTYVYLNFDDLNKEKIQYIFMHIVGVIVVALLLYLVKTICLIKMLSCEYVQAMKKCEYEDDKKVYRYVKSLAYELIHHFKLEDKIFPMSLSFIWRIIIAACSTVVLPLSFSITVIGLALLFYIFDFIEYAKFAFKWNKIRNSLKFRANSVFS